MDGTGELLLTRILEARLGHFRHEPLDQHSYALGEAIRAGGAWAQPERWGTWLCHSGGDLVFDLPEEPGQFDFVWLRLRVCGVLHEQPIRLRANGELLWAGKIGPHSRDVMLRVRKRTVPGKSWRMRIGVDLDLSPETRNAIAALDGRMPTVGFERMIVVPDSDVAARLDVLTKLVMSRQ